MVKKKNVAKGINLLIHHGGVTSTNTNCQVSFFFFNATPLFHPASCFWVYTAQALMEPLWEVLWLPWWGSWTWTKYPLVHSPIQKSTIELTSAVSPPMPMIICVWQTCDGLSRVLFSLYLLKTVCRHDKMYNHMHRPPDQSKILGWVPFCHAAKFQYLNGSWFLIFLEIHHSRAGASLLPWSPSSTESRMVNPVSSRPTSSCCFDSEQGMLSGQLSVGQLAGNASFFCDTRVDSLPLASCTDFHLHPAPGYG